MRFLLASVLLLSFALLLCVDLGVASPSVTFGSHWVLGDMGTGHFVVNKVSGGSRPQMLIRQDSYMFRSHKSGRAPNEWRHAGQTAGNMRLGNWFIGEKDSGHFVISQINTAICQFLMREDSRAFYDPKAGRAPNEWRHAGASSNVLAVGDWLVGPKDDGHFVISHRPSSTCTFLIRNDGYVFYTGDHGKAPDSWTIFSASMGDRPKRCNGAKVCWNGNSACRCGSGGCGFPTCSFPGCAAHCVGHAVENIANQVGKAFKKLFGRRLLDTNYNGTSGDYADVEAPSATLRATDQADNLLAMLEISTGSHNSNSEFAEAGATVGWSCG